ncbi:putative ribonuclease H-like domain-containing protein [Tanacetum coccineum]
MMERELGEGYSFIKKKCFVCGSLSHLIKDCDYYEKKMAREAEFKKQRVFNTGNRVAKPVWTNANRVNHANHFVPRPVQLNAVRQNVNSVRPNVNTGRVNVNSVRLLPIDRNTAKMSYFNAVKGNWGTAVKTSAGYNWRNSRPNSNCDSGPTFIRTVNAKGHMTGNKDHLDDFEEYKGGSVTFGGSKGYITGKGRIRVGNLDFDSVSFVKELGHFNLFSISQICDKLDNGSISKTECLVVYPNRDMLEFCGNKGIKQEYSNARTPQQNGVAERMNRTLIEAARNYAAELTFLPNNFLGRCSTSEVTNSARTLQSPNANASEEAYEDEELIVVSTAIKHSAAKVRPRKSSTNSKGREVLNELQTFTNTREEAFSTGNFRRNSSMQEELLQFRLQQVWILVDLPHGAKVIGTKWVYRNKRDERGVVVRNKARFVARSQDWKEDVIIFGSTRKGRFSNEFMVNSSSSLGFQSQTKDRWYFLFLKKVVARHAEKIHDSSANRLLINGWTRFKLVGTIVNPGHDDNQGSFLTLMFMPEARSLTVAGHLFLWFPLCSTKVIVWRQSSSMTKQTTWGKPLGSGRIFKDIDDDPLVYFVTPTKPEAAKTLSNVASQRSKSVDKGKRYKRRKEFKGKDFETLVQALRISYDRGQRKKSSMIVKRLSSKRTKEQNSTKKLEKKNELTEQQKQRKAQSFEAQHYNGRRICGMLLELSLERTMQSSISVIAKDMSEEDFAKRMVDLVNQRKKYFAEERAKAKRKEKEKEPVKKMGKRRKQIARKGLHTAKDEAEKDEASEEDDSSSGINVPINPVPVAVKSPSIASYKIIKQGMRCIFK